MLHKVPFDMERIMKTENAMLDFMKYIELDRNGQSEEASEFFKKNISVPSNIAQAVGEIKGENYLKDQGYMTEHGS
jgi:hypothetical protein